MKLGEIEIVLKSPDGLHASIERYMEQWPDKIKANIKPHEDWEDEYFAILDEVKNKLKKFVKYDEYVTIKVNLDNLTATVIPAN